MLKKCLFRASDANEQYVGQLTTPVGWGKNADNAGGITPDLNVRRLSLSYQCIKRFIPDRQKGIHEKNPVCQFHLSDSAQVQSALTTKLIHCAAHNPQLTSNLTQMVSDLPVINPEACADYYGSIIYSGIMCIDSAGGKGVCNVSISPRFEN